MICKICNIDKEASSFYLRKDNGLYRTECKMCLNKLNKDYRLNGIKKNKIINIENERWEDIIDFIGLYQISDHGRLRSKERIIICKNGRFRTIKEAILKPSGFLDEYHTVTLVKDGVCYYFSIHRLVALHFLENPENKPQVNHKDGNKSNNHYLNLEWNTIQENCDHKLNVLKVKFPEGALNKLSFSILIIDKNGNQAIDKGIKSIARKYNLDVSGVMRVLKNKQESFNGYKFKYL